MTQELGYYPPDGPMALGEEYRWNVPVITYGFDQSFLDYFGQPGVDAVEAAIQIINDLPPASEIVLTNYNLLTTRVNFAAQEQQLYDLKSRTLSILLQQLGLATPTRSLWALRRWDPWWCEYQASKGWSYLPEFLIPMDDFLTYYCDQKNYDPVTQQASREINGSLYSFIVMMGGTNCNEATVYPYPVDPLTPVRIPIADRTLELGVFHTGLTMDDVGGLLYLLSKTNINVETLDGTVMPTAENSNVLIRTAARPGLEKITFLRQATNNMGNFSSMTNFFADVYFTNGTTVTQSVQRITTQPDFVFSGKDFGPVVHLEYPGGAYMGYRDLEASDTKQWINNRIINGNPEGYGPGVIRGPVQITFHTPGKYLAAAGSSTNSAGQFWNWGSFSTSGNIVTFPGNQTNLTSLTLSIKSVFTNGTSELEWIVLGHQGAAYQIDVSTNLINWTSATTITNTNGIFTFRHPLNQPAQYFRAVLKEESGM